MTKPKIETNEDVQIHIWPLRVYYEDTDAQAIVYYANYLKFMERGRTEMFRNLDMSLSKIQHEHGAFVVAGRCDVKFKRPAKLEDLLHVHTSVFAVSGAKIVLSQNVMRGEAVLVSALVELALVNEQTNRPIRIPKTIRCKLGW